MHATETDRVTLPASERRFDAPSGRFHLIIKATSVRPDAPHIWSTPDARATLIELVAGQAQEHWMRPIPHPYGPRHALVTDTGATVLIDTWLNVKSPHAVQVFDPKGRLIADHSYESVRDAMGVTDKHITDHAERGWWVGGVPELNADQTAARVPAAESTLRVDLIDGTLSRSP